MAVQRLDPAFVAASRQAARETMRAVNLRRARRIAARAIVVAAGLPLLRANVDRAAEMLARGATADLARILLSAERRVAR